MKKILVRGRNFLKEEDISFQRKKFSVRENIYCDRKQFLVGEKDFLSKKEIFYHRKIFSVRVGNLFVSEEKFHVSGRNFLLQYSTSFYRANI